MRNAETSKWPCGNVVAEKNLLIPGAVDCPVLGARSQFVLANFDVHHEKLFHFLTVPV